MKSSGFARDHGLRLDTVDDAMTIIAAGVPGCIFTLDDIADDFFVLENRRAGDVFQKLINYSSRIAVVVPSDHSFGDRVTELAREHASHPIVRFFETPQDALQWRAAISDRKKS